VGLAYYSLRQYDEAEASFGLVRSMDPYRLLSMDTYSNILYVKEKQAELSALAHSVVEVEKFCPETCCVVGNYYSLKGRHERAVQYFQRALRLNGQYLSAWTLMGHEYMELRNTSAAIQCYRNAVQISEVQYVVCVVMEVDHHLNLSSSLPFLTPT
jgi:anaphase-promoting complex subunit 8